MAAKKQKQETQHRQMQQGRMSSGSYYTYGNVAHELQPQYSPRPERDSRREEAARAERAEARERRILSAKMIGVILILFVGCIAFMGMHVAVENLNVSIRKQRSELADLKSSNAILQAELTEQLDLDYIKQEATERLGMAEPQAYQIIYIDVPKQSYTIQYEGEQQEEAPSLLSRIKSVLKKDG